MSLDRRVPMLIALAILVLTVLALTIGAVGFALFALGYTFGWITAS